MREEFSGLSALGLSPPFGAGLSRGHRWWRRLKDPLGHWVSLSSLWGHPGTVFSTDRLGSSGAVSPSHGREAAKRFHLLSTHHL